MMILRALKAAKNGGIDLPARLYWPCQGIASGTMAMITLHRDTGMIHVAWRTMTHAVDVLTPDEAERCLALV